MQLTLTDMEQICAIGHESSMRGSGQCLRDLINQSRYRELRPSLTRSNLADYIMSHQELIKQWSMYSDDKRTNGGWYFMQVDNGWETGRVGPAGLIDKAKSLSAVEACADYILKELDFWSSVK